MTITKERIITDVFEQTDLSKNNARQSVELLLEIIKTTLAEERDVLISGFGKFEVKRKRERRGRNPQTREDLQLRARRVVTFKPSGILRKLVNGEAVDKNSSHHF